MSICVDDDFVAEIHCLKFSLQFDRCAIFIIFIIRFMKSTNELAVADYVKEKRRARFSRRSFFSRK